MEPLMIPCRTLSAPRVGSVSNMPSTRIFRGRLPLLSALEMFWTSSMEKRPVIWALPPVIASLMFGAQ